MECEPWMNIWISHWPATATAYIGNVIGPTRPCDAWRHFTVEAGHRKELLGNLLPSAGDIHAPNRAERLQPRTHSAELDMSQLSTRPEERSRCSIARRSPIQASGPRNSPCRRFTSPAGQMIERRRRGPTGAVLLVRPLQSLAPDLEVEESSSELGQDETISWRRCIDIGSGGAMTQRNCGVL